MAAADVKIPGAFGSYLEGSGVMAGEPYYDDERDSGAAELRAAWAAAKPTKAGKGHYYTVTLSDPWAFCILAEYAAMCIEVNTYGDSYGGEKQAAQKVIDRVTATGRVASRDSFAFVPADDGQSTEGATVVPPAGWVCGHGNGPEATAAEAVVACPECP